MNKNMMLSNCDDEEEDAAMKRVNVTRVNNHIYFYDEINDLTHRVFQQLFEEAKQYIYASNGASMFESGRLEEGVIIHINSPGGYASDSLAMYDFLKEQDIPSMGIIEGVCASGATLVLCGCSVRLMTKHSYALLHELRGALYGKFSALQDDDINNRWLMKVIKEIYLKETKIPPEEIDGLLTHDIYWDVETCKKYGIVTGAIGEEITPEVNDIKEAIKEKEEELKQLKGLLPAKKLKPASKPRKSSIKKPASKEKTDK